MIQGSVSIEPRGLIAGSEGKKPDFCAHIQGSIYLGDVTIRHPNCPRYQPTAATSARHAAQTGEKDKIRDYPNAGRDIGAEFVPFSIETYGQLGLRAVNFIDQLVGHAANVSPATAKQARWMLTKGLSLVLQRGNALTTMSALQACKEELATQARLNRLHQRENAFNDSAVSRRRGRRAA